MSYCGWNTASALDRIYHDTEWGVPVHDDRKQFEYLMLEALQCGLSWEIILRKREIFRHCFAGFDYDIIAQFTEADIRRLMDTPEMLHSERKIRAVINNAGCFQNIRKEFGSFSGWLWAHSADKTILYEGHNNGLSPVSNGLSARIARELKKRGFKYLGAVTVYSHLQACGIICDHDLTCPCYKKIINSYPTVKLPPDNEVF